MKKLVTIVTIALIAVSAYAQKETPVYEKDWVGVTEYTYWHNPDAGEPFMKLVEEGLAITNSRMQDNSMTQQLAITEDNISLEEGHDYIVRLTLKVPTDGKYYIQLGNWFADWYDEVSVTASEDWQVIDVNYPNFYFGMQDGHALLGNGWVVGTTILKKVQVIEKTNDNRTAVNAVKTTNADGAIYNLAGQKVDASYRGIVIQNGKKRLAR